MLGKSGGNGLTPWFVQIGLLLLQLVEILLGTCGLSVVGRWIRHALAGLVVVYRWSPHVGIVAIWGGALTDLLEVGRTEVGARSTDRMTGARSRNYLWLRRLLSLVVLHAICHGWGCSSVSSHVALIVLQMGRQAVLTWHRILQWGASHIVVVIVFHPAVEIRRAFVLMRAVILKHVSQKPGRWILLTHVSETVNGVIDIT